MTHPLEGYWYPLARSTDVDAAGKPLAVKLLDIDIVLWRSSEGVMAFRDLCIHRGTKLSLGWVDKDQLVCPYHGWCYGKDGATTRIPSVPADRPIPAKARAEKFQCVERYGLVFVCLGEPKQPIYDVPQLESEEYRTHLVGPIYWKTGAARSFENFIDEAHLPWAHPGLLGDPSKAPPIPSRDLKMTNRGFFFEYDAEAINRIDPSKKSINRLTYDVQLPFTLLHEHRSPEGHNVIDLFIVTPISRDESARFMVVGRNFGLDQSPDKFIQYSNKLWEQDRVVIESQRPEQVPLDWNSELHVRGPDGPAIAYRKLLSEIGIHDEV